MRVIKPRELKLAGHIATIEEGKSDFKILTDKTIEERPLGRPNAYMGGQYLIRS